MARQLPLDLAHGEAKSRDDLVVGPSNAQAVVLVDRWPDWPSPVAILAGPAGSGKSHLAHVWLEASGARAFYTAGLGREAVEAAGHGPVLIDDIDSGDLDEAGLFHLINAVRQANTSLLMTARRFPAAWGVTLPDLASRLKAASTVEIHEPDDMLLAAVTTKLFADRQIEVEPHVVQFLVRRVERSLSSVIEAVTRIDRAALERKSRITRALAAQVVEAMEAGQGDPAL
jgi:chromosomal replication initiation ATPase DnaA